MSDLDHEPRPPARRMEVASPALQLTFHTDSWSLNHARLTLADAVALRAVLNEGIAAFVAKFGEVAA